MPVILSANVIAICAAPVMCAAHFPFNMGAIQSDAHLIGLAFLILLVGTGLFANDRAGLVGLIGHLGRIGTFLNHPPGNGLAEAGSGAPVDPNACATTTDHPARRPEGKLPTSGFCRGQAPKAMGATMMSETWVFLGMPLSTHVRRPLSRVKAPNSLEAAA